MTAWIPTIVGIFVFGVGAALFLRPPLLRKIVATVAEDYRRVVMALGIRLGLGLLLIWAAEASRWPTVVYVIGVLAVLAAVIGFAMGRRRLLEFLAWAGGRSDTTVRAWAVAAGAFGVVLAVAGVGPGP